MAIHAALCAILTSLSIYLRSVYLLCGASLTCTGTAAGWAWQYYKVEYYQHAD
jgi:hypothetical protein